jgi:DNA-nicking Smr family endonuclease
VTDEDPVPLPITDELDLHTFRPNDLGDLIPAYLEACREKGIPSVRIIHGKGSGTLRTTTHNLLARLPYVARMEACDERSGSWGATRVYLKP